MDLVCPKCDFEFEYEPLEDEESCPNCNQEFALVEEYNESNWWWGIDWNIMKKERDA